MISFLHLFLILRAFSPALICFSTLFSLVALLFKSRCVSPSAGFNSRKHLASVYTFSRCTISYTEQLERIFRGCASSAASIVHIFKHVRTRGCVIKTHSSRYRSSRHAYLEFQGGHHKFAVNLYSYRAL